MNRTKLVSLSRLLLSDSSVEVSGRLRKILCNLFGPPHLRRTPSKYVIHSLSACKIKSVMLPAAGIERGGAAWAVVTACHVLIDCHFISANAAEHCSLSPFRLRPDLDCVAGQSLVTLFAGIIDAAALYLDGDNVESRSIVSAASLRIHIDSANLSA
jgi:hypothetical protein